MNGFTRTRAGLVHPNAVVAKREHERQEQSRLHRLSEVKGTRPNSAAGVRAATKRPGSAAALGRDGGRERDLGNCESPVRGRIRPRSRPPSAPSQRSWTGPGDSPTAPSPTKCAYTPNARPAPVAATSAPTGVTAAEKAAAAKSAASRGRRSASEAAPPRLRTSFMLSPQRRFEDAQAQLQMNSAAEHQALMEELQGWYFGAAELSELNLLGGTSLMMGSARDNLVSDLQGSPSDCNIPGCPVAVC